MAWVEYAYERFYFPIVLMSSGPFRTDCLFPDYLSPFVI